MMRPSAGCRNQPWWLQFGVFVFFVLFMTVPLLCSAQTRDLIPGVPGDLTTGEVQRLFDAYALVQAQEMLKLTEEQYPQFVAKLKILQESRRETQRGRQKLMRNLQRLANQAELNNSIIQTRLDELESHERSAAESLEAAYEGVYSILNLRQKVRFRLFEQTMERRRLDLLMRVRSQRRPRDQQR